MSDYTKLVEALRLASDYGVDEEDVERLCADAAAAIEDMAKHITEMHERVTVLQIARGELEAEVKRLKLHCADCEYGNSPWPEEPGYEPKRGEWIIDGAYTYNLRELNGKAYEPVYRCSCCNRQTESYVRLDEPKMPEDADFPEYCPHCGAKMEVQE